MSETGVTWTRVKDYTDVAYEHSGTGIARVTIDRPEVRNAFRPETVDEMIDAFRDIRDDGSIGVALLTGAGDTAARSRAEAIVLAAPRRLVRVVVEPGAGHAVHLEREARFGDMVLARLTATAGSPLDGATAAGASASGATAAGASAAGATAAGTSASGATAAGRTAAATTAPSTIAADGAPPSRRPPRRTA